MIVHLKITNYLTVEAENPDQAINDLYYNDRRMVNEDTQVEVENE